MDMDSGEGEGPQTALASPPNEENKEQMMITN